MTLINTKRYMIYVNELTPKTQICHFKRQNRQLSTVDETKVME